MLFAVFAKPFSVVLDLLSLLARSERENTLDILVLRPQLRILQRTQACTPRLSWWEQLPLTHLAGKLIQRAADSRTWLSHSLLLFSPETLLRWHRDLVRHTWTFRHRRASGRSGRPRIDPELERLTVRLARENPGWDYSK